MASLSKKQYDTSRIPGSRIFGRDIVVTGRDEIMNGYLDGLARVPPVEERRSKTDNGYFQHVEGLLSFYDH